LERHPERGSVRNGGDDGRGLVIPLPLSQEGLAAFRRGYRWLNLTLVQQGTWPLLVVVFAAPVTPLALTPLPWYWARLAAPLLASLLALAYLAQRPGGLSVALSLRDAGAPSERARPLRNQVTFLIVGLTVAVAALRLVEGPLIPVLKLEAFGLAETAAYQLINFGLVGRTFSSGVGWALPIALFGLSWGLHDLFLAAVSPVAESLVLSFASGAVLGLAFGAIVAGLRRWPGGFWSAMAFQFLVVYLVFGFVTP
jgi:hypothetical protein